MQRKYRHLFFDLDRTLWDYENNASEALNEIYHAYNLVTIFAGFSNFHLTFTKHNNDLWKEYREGKVHKDILRTLRFERTLLDYESINPSLAIELNNDFLEISPRKPHLIPGAIQLLEYLIKMRYNLYIITNGFTKIQLLKMETSGLTGYFDKIFTSENTRSNKPQRAIFEHAVTSVNARKLQSIMIGDDLETDIIGARNFGIDQVYFNPEGISHNEKITYEISELTELLKIFA